MNRFGRRGFTLTEVLIGLIILAIGILAIAGMQITSIRGTSFSNNLSQASVIAQERLEELKNLPMRLPGVGLNPALSPGNYTDPNLPPPLDIFQRSYQIEDHLPEYLTIRYTVQWVEKGVTHSVSFTTIKSR